MGFLTILFDNGLSLHEIETVLWLHAQKMYVLEAKTFERYRLRRIKEAPYLVASLLQQAMDAMWS
jgi:hypothetical protein